MYNKSGKAGSRFTVQAVIIFIALLISANNAFSQEEKLDFTSSWKTKTTKNVLSISIIKGTTPVSCYIYESSPFTGGQLIKQIDNIDSKKFEIELEKKADVYVCLYKNENNLAARWARTSK